jgi:hypothetical protein
VAVVSAVGELAERVLADVQACLDAADRKVKRAVVTVGAATWDECCEGMLYVNIVRTFRSENFPLEDATWTPCRSNPLAVEMLVGVIRCSPMPDDRGNLPKADDITTTSRSVLDDAQTVYRCLNGWGCDEDRASVLTGQTMLADQGGCIGVETRILVEL